MTEITLTGITRVQRELIIWAYERGGRFTWDDVAAAHFNIRTLGALGYKAITLWSESGKLIHLNHKYSGAIRAKLQSWNVVLRWCEDDAAAWLAAHLDQPAPPSCAPIYTLDTPAQMENLQESMTENPPDDWFSYDDWEREQDKRAEYEFNYWNYGSGGGGVLSCPNCGSQAIEYKGGIDDPIDGNLDRYQCRTCEHWWDESDLQDTPIIPMQPIGARAEFDAARADLLAAQKGFNAAHGWELIGALETLRDAQFRYLAAAKRLNEGGGGGALDCAAKARRDYHAGHLFMRRSMRAGWDAESIMKFTLEFLNPNRAFLLGMSSFVSMGFRDHVRYWNQPYMWHDFTAQKKHSRTYFLQTVDEIPF